VVVTALRSDYIHMLFRLHALCYCHDFMISRFSFSVLDILSLSNHFIYLF
jgi:hypothetical protein